MAGEGVMLVPPSDGEKILKAVDETAAFYSYDSDIGEMLRTLAAVIEKELGVK